MSERIHGKAKMSYGKAVVEQKPNDALREAVRSAVTFVYNRHDHTAPLNHVNVSEFVDAVMAVVPVATKPTVPVCMYCGETRAQHEHYSGACQARGSGNTRYSERSGWNT